MKRVYRQSVIIAALLLAVSGVLLVLFNFSPHSETSVKIRFTRSTSGDTDSVPQNDLYAEPSPPDTNEPDLSDNPEFSADPETTPDTEYSADIHAFPESFPDTEFFPEPDFTEGTGLLPAEEPTHETDPPSETETPFETEVLPESVSAPDAEPPQPGIRLDVTDSGTGVVVYTYSELYDALNKNNGYTHIYLGADIVMTGGIIVNSSKKTFTIDGINPLDPDAGRHTLTEYSSAAIDGAIYLLYSGPYTVTVKNMIIQGKNFYGTVSVSALYSLDITYENVEYTGPQLSYNTIGTCRIIDSIINVTTSNGSTSLVEELCQARNVVFGGTVTVTGTTSTNSLMWLTGSNAALTVLDNASVTINVPNSYMIYSDGGAVTCTVGANARIVIRTRYSLFYDYNGALHQFKTLTLESGAVFEAYQSERNTLTRAPTVKISGNLTVSHGARFVVKAEHASAEPLVQFMTNGAGAVFSEPRSVVLSNTYGRIFGWYTGSGTVTLTADTVCYWQEAAAESEISGLAKYPTRFWHTYTHTPLTFTSAASTTITQQLSSNFIEGTDYGEAVTVSSFDITKAQMLTFGHLPLTLDPPVADAGVVTGETLPYAFIRTEHTSYGVMDDSAGDDGLICVYVPELDYPGDVYVTVQSGFLYRTGSAAVLPADGTGAILSFLHVPDTIPFGIVPISPKESLHTQILPEFTIVLSDTRTMGSAWTLQVRVVTPLSGTDGDVYPDALYFDGSPVGETLHTAASGVKDTEEHTTKIYKPREDGFTIKLPPAAPMLGKYSAVVEWTLIDGP